MKAPSRDFLRLINFGWTRSSQCWRTNDVCSGDTVGVVGLSSIVPTSRASRASLQFDWLIGSRLETAPSLSPYLSGVSINKFCPVTPVTPV